jgi:hypothetical protein
MRSAAEEFPTERPAAEARKPLGDLRFRALPSDEAWAGCL